MRIGKSNNYFHRLICFAVAFFSLFHFPFFVYSSAVLICLFLLSLDKYLTHRQRERERMCSIKKSLCPYVHRVTINIYWNVIMYSIEKLLLHKFVEAVYFAFCILSVVSPRYQCVHMALSYRYVHFVHRHWCSTRDKLSKRHAYHSIQCLIWFSQLQ